MAWIEKGKKNRYCDYFTDPLTHKRHKISVTIEKDTPQARNKAKNKLDELIAMRTMHTPDKLFLHDLTKLYLQAQKSIVKPSTYGRNKAKCNVYEKIFGNIDINQLTAGMVKAAFMKRNPKPGTVNENLIRFKAMLRWAYQNDFIKDASIIDKLTPLKDNARKEGLKDKYLEKEDLKLLLDAMKVETWHNLTKFLVLSGCRIGEALALNEDDIDLINREITISKTYDSNNRVVTDPKTYASNRKIYMQDDLYALTRSIIAHNQKTRRTLFFIIHHCFLTLQAHTRTIMHIENTCGKHP